MKLSIFSYRCLALCLATLLPSCSIGIDSDGSKSVSLDTVALANALSNYNASKATK